MDTDSVHPVYIKSRHILEIEVPGSNVSLPSDDLNIVGYGLTQS